MPVFVEKAFWGFIGLDNCHIEYEWDSSEISILSGAADLIALAIIRKRTVESLAEAESRLRLAFEVAQMGHWRYDCKTDAVQWFEGHEKLYGISPETFKGTLAAVQEMVHPDDRSQGEENLRRTIEENVPFDNTYRVIHPDQSIHWLHSYGHLYCDADGGPSYVFGVTQEITGFKNAEAELKQRCDELELFHDVTVGRELRMIELKKEINALLETIGQPEKYEIIGEDT
jgi:PAS domain S-box-containing protein